MPNAIRMASPRRLINYRKSFQMKVFKWPPSSTEVENFQGMKPHCNSKGKKYTSNQARMWKWSEESRWRLIEKKTLNGFNGKSNNDNQPCQNNVLMTLISILNHFRTNPVGHSQVVINRNRGKWNWTKQCRKHLSIPAYFA